MMRWLLALLIVLNLGLFLWTRMQVDSTQSSPPQSIRPPGVQDILLLREMAQQQITSAAPEPPQTHTPASGDLPLSGTVEDMVSEAQTPGSMVESQIGASESPVLATTEVSETAVAEPVAQEKTVTLPPVVESVAPEKTVTVPPVEEPVAPAETVTVSPVEEPVAPEKTVTVPRVVEPVCGRIGPYTDKATAEKHRDSSQHAGIFLDLLQTKEQIQKGYWVLIPALPNRREALQVVGRLKEAGVTDLWRFQKGPMRNAISLGWYSGPTNASSHSGNINKKGFNSEVTPRMVEQTRYWVSYKTVDEQALAGLLSDLPSNLQNEKKACE